MSEDTIRLIRLSDNPEGANNAVYGTIYFGNDQVHSMERPWIPSEEYPSGKSNESCFPVGTYDLVKDFSPKYGHEMWYAVNHDLGVYLRPEDRQHDWQRWGCMIHSANWVNQLNGCVAPGLTRGMIGSTYGIGSSKAAQDKLYSYIETLQNPKISVEWD
jgi:hypothetical protein